MLVSSTGVEKLFRTFVFFANFLVVTLVFRRRFRADVEESMAESREMEDVRLELEMERHTMRTDAQRDSGLPEMDDPRGHVTLNGSANGRRLSFNSLDSGMVEESCETSA